MKEEIGEHRYSRPSHLLGFFCLWSRCFPNLLDGVDRGEGDLEGPGFEALMTQHTASDGLFRRFFHANQTQASVGPVGPETSIEIHEGNGSGGGGGVGGGGLKESGEGKVV